MDRWDRRVHGGNSNGLTDPVPEEELDESLPVVLGCDGEQRVPMLIRLSDCVSLDSEAVLSP